MVETTLPSCLREGTTYENALARPTRLFGVADTLYGGSGPAFGAIQHLAVGSDESIWVIDAFARQVLRIDSTWVARDSLGRSGSGPGEFEQPSRLAVSADATVSVFDPALWRVTRFRADGTVLTERMEPDVSMGQFPEVAFDSRGRALRLGFVEFEAALQRELTEGTGRVVRGRNAIQRWDAGLGSWTTLIEIPGREVYLTPGASLRDPPFAARPVWAPATDGGFWYGDGASSTLTRFSDEGDRVCSVSLGIDPIAVSSSERQGYYDASDYGRMSPEVRENEQRSRQNVPVPEYKPVMRHAFATSADNNLWVNGARPAGSEEDIWYVVNFQRNAVRRVSVPETFLPLAVGVRGVYGVQVDEMGTPSVAIYEVEGSDAGR